MSKIIGKHAKSPQTNWTSYSLTIGATTTAPTKGASPVVDQATWRRVGDSIEIEYNYVQTAAGSAGSGTYLFPLPAGITADTSKITVGTAMNSAMSIVGKGSAYTQSGGLDVDSSVDVMLYNSTNLCLRIGQAISNGGVSTSNVFVSDTNNGLARNPQSYRFFARIPVSGWSANDLLKTATDTKV